MTTPVTLTSQIPVAYTKRIARSTSIAFSIECMINIISFSIEIDEKGIGQWATVHNGVSFQPPYSGTVSGVPSMDVDVVINARTYDVHAPVHIRVVAKNSDDEEYTLRYWFRIVPVADQITPRYPVHGEKLVSTGESLAIDFRDPGEDPLLITVNGTVVYDDSLSPKFRNSWTGSYIDDAEGQRIVLIPPAPLTIHTNYTVVVNTAAATKTYTFRVGSQQITTSNDAESPKITEATAAALWIGYVRNGRLYLRKGNPLTGAVEVIETGQFEHGYDPTLGKYILYWVDRGKIYYATADPTDTPETLVPPNDANSEVRIGLGSDKIPFLGDHDEVLLAPHVRGAPPDADLDVDIYRPTGDPEATQVVGFIVYKFIAGTFQKIAEIPIAAGETLATFTDPTLTPGAEYSAAPIYSVGGRRVEGPMSPRVAPPDYSGLVKLGLGSDIGPSVPSSQYVKSQSYPPLSLFFPDTVRLGLGSDSGPRLTYTIFTIFSFFTQDTVAIGLGSGRPGTLKGTGFGIIGVG